MPLTNVTVSVAGGSWSAWTKAHVGYSAKNAVREFTLDVTDGTSSWTDQWNFMPGTAVTISESGQTMLTGFVNTLSPKFAKDKHDVHIAGKSKSQDTVDSSVDHPTGEFRNQNILQIANALDKQGVGFHAGPNNPTMPVLDYFRVNPHESVFEAVDRIARKQQLLLIGQPDGSIAIDAGGTQSANGPLIEGFNILEGEATFDDSKKQSKYTVKGHKASGSSKADIDIKGEAVDGSVKRNRPKTIPNDAATDNPQAKKRAEHHRDRQHGESIKASIKVQGWVDQNGTHYRANSLIYVNAPTLKLNMSLLIDTVSCDIDNSGSFTTLSLVHPKAFGSSAGAGSQADPAWTPEGF